MQQKHRTIYVLGGRVAVISHIKENLFAINFSMMKTTTINLCIYKLNKSRLDTYFTLSFTYDFLVPNDFVKFAYCVPYTYTEQLSLVN